MVVYPGKVVVNAVYLPVSTFQVGGDSVAPFDWAEGAKYRSKSTQSKALASSTFLLVMSTVMTVLNCACMLDSVSLTPSGINSRTEWTPRMQNCSALDVSEQAPEVSRVVYVTSVLETFAAGLLLLSWYSPALELHTASRYTLTFRASPTSAFPSLSCG